MSIAVTPINPSLAAGQQQQFTATGTYSDGSDEDLTNTAAWTSSAPSIATIRSGGLATALAAGSTTIKATSGSINGSTILTVTTAILVSIAVTPVILCLPPASSSSSLPPAPTATHSEGPHQ